MLAAALVLLATLDPRTLKPESLEECDALVAQHPREYEAYWCYTKMSFRKPIAEWHERTLAHLKARIARDPRDLLSRLVLALNDHYDEERDNAEFTELAPQLRAQRLFVAELGARGQLALNHCAVGRYTAAEEQLAAAAEAAAASGVADLAAWAEMTAARCALSQADYGRAQVLLASARARLDAAPESWLTAWLRGNVLDGSGQLYAATGRHAEALEVYRAQLEALAQNPFTHACARHRVAEEAVLLSRQGAMPAEEAGRLVQEALDDEVKQGCLSWASGGELATRRLRARLLGSTDEGLAEARRALAQAREHQADVKVCGAARLLAELAAGRAPAEALAAADSAVELAHVYGSGLELARGLLVRAFVRHSAGERRRALDDALLALEQFDLLRARQPDATVRARSASAWSFAYHYVAGLLLEEPADPEQALSAMERLRARVLLDLLEAGPAPPEVLPLRSEREELLASLSRVQRLLLDPELPPARRSERLGELARLEEREDALRERIARAWPGATRREAPPTLAALQQALAPDEALLLFQIFEPDRGEDWLLEAGSWVLAVSREGARALRVPEAQVLEGRVHLFAGLIERRDGSEAQAARTLHEALLAPALAALPPGVRKLTVVPDGPLHRLAFEALRDREGAPLAARYRVSLAPSAALWLRWRRSPVPAAEVPALALGDPATGMVPAPELADAALARRGAESFQQGLRLAPLPFARQEARAVVETLGGGSALRLGPEASERFLKTAPLGRYGVLHLATHAVVDEVRPERSAIVLAPGAPEEDGLLQARELPGLQLGGRVVVLASCLSSSGERLQGEGVMSLARGFFEAGARTVVGALWPLRDDEAARLFGAFYRHLGAGLPVAEAMARARRDRIAEGAPAAAWAGLVVLGDGDAAPVNAPGTRDLRGLRWWPAGLTLLVAGALGLARLRRRAR